METFQDPWRPSRLWQPTDAKYVESRTFYAGIRPRGILSGLFVITTPSEPATLQSSKGTPLKLRLRLNDSFYEEGPTVLLAYRETERIVLEDVLVWKGQDVWSNTSFIERWTYMKQFLQEWKPDTELQGIRLDVASYTSLSAIRPPDSSHLIELIPNQARQKRLIVMLEAEPIKVDLAVEWIATRDSSKGPDVYTVTKKGSTESEGIASVQSLAVSRALRLHPSESFPVRCHWHERFQKWEIIGVLLS
jgi:hypothetical protein